MYFRRGNPKCPALWGSFPREQTPNNTILKTKMEGNEPKTGQNRETRVCNGKKLYYKVRSQKGRKKEEKLQNNPKQKKTTQKSENGTKKGKEKRKRRGKDRKERIFPRKTRKKKERKKRRKNKQGERKKE